MFASVVYSSLYTKRKKIVTQVNLIIMLEPQTVATGHSWI